jgi:hypothetical protein
MDRRLAEAPKGPRSSDFCRTRLEFPNGRCGRKYGGGRLGRARSLPGWNWSGRARWCWGRGDLQPIRVTLA